MNLTESKALDNGYKFVWEFTPNQGNGTIVAAALTSAQGGANAYGSLVNDSSTFLQIKSIKLDGMAMEQELVLFEAVGCSCHKKQSRMRQRRNLVPGGEMKGLKILFSLLRWDLRL